MLAFCPRLPQAAGGSLTAACLAALHTPFFLEAPSQRLGRKTLPEFAGTANTVGKAQCQSGGSHAFCFSRSCPEQRSGRVASRKVV